MTKIDRESVDHLTDDELLAQLNAFDPYDDEFRRRFLALRAALDEAEARAAEALERVRAEERERCAEAADTYATAWDADPSDDYFKGWIRAAERIAATIRARGET